MPIKLNSTGGGSVTIDVPNISTSNTLTLPAITGNVITSADSNTITQPMISRSGFYGGFGPAFSAYLGTNQSVSGSTYTKVQVGTEEFDTANCFDSTTNYRFTPNVAGYYQINGTVSVGSTSITRAIVYIKKNDTYFKRGNDLTVGYSATVSSVIYFNGTTDYVELFGYVTATTPLFNSLDTYFSGALLRPA